MIRAKRHPLVSRRSPPCHKSPESTVSLSVLVLFIIFWPTVETFIWLWLYGEWSPTELRRLCYHENQDYKVFQDSHTCHEVFTDFVLEMSLFRKHGRSEVFNSYHASTMRNKIRFTLVSDRNRFFTETPNTETGLLDKPKFGRNRMRNSLISAKIESFRPKDSRICRNRMFRPK